MNRKEYRGVRKPRSGWGAITRNEGVIVGLAEANPSWQGASLKPGDQVTRIGRSAIFQDTVDAMRSIAEVGRSGTIRPTETNVVINPSVITDPPSPNSGYEGLGGRWNSSGEVDLGSIDAAGIDTVAGRRKAAEALNLPSVPKSRRKYNRQKENGRG